MSRTEILGGIIVLVCATLALAAAKQRTIEVDVQDHALGQPIAGATVIVDCSGQKQQTRCDDQGQCIVVIAPGVNPRSITVEKDGYVSQRIVWPWSGPAKLPEALNFSLPPAVRVGGFVRDAHDEPVAGAVVKIGGMNQTANGEIQTDISGSATTDAQGRWTINTAPANLESALLQVSAAGFANDPFYRNYPPAQMRAQSLVLVLHRPVSISGRVIGPDGKGIFNASVGMGRPQEWMHHWVVTDKQGNFKLDDLPPGPMVLLVLSGQYAPAEQDLNVPTTQPVTVQPHHGLPLRLHVADRKGKPIRHAIIEVTGWKNISMMDDHLLTDADGNATWTNAPAGEMELEISKLGMGSISMRSVKAGGPPIEVTMGPPTKVHGKVIDARTGEPIKDFRVIPGEQWNSQNTRWDINGYNGMNPPVMEAPGQFTFTTYPAPRQTIRIEADGYLPTDSRFFGPGEGDISLIFKLKHGRNIAGTVYSPDHQAAQDAKVYLVPANQILQMENGRVMFDDGCASTTTDSMGQFSFPPREDSFALVCLTQRGHSELLAPSLTPAPKSSRTPGWPEQLYTTSLSTTRPASYDLTIQPWARVEGKLMIGSKAGAIKKVEIQGAPSSGGADRPRVYYQYSTTTDANGHFEFDRVVAGKVKIGQQISTGWNVASMTQGTPIKAVAGKTIHVKIGGEGRPVIGRFNMPATLQSGQWVTKIANLSLHHQPVGPKPPALPDTLKNASPRAKSIWYMKWRQTPAGRAYMAAQIKADLTVSHRDYVVLVKPDSSFRVNDVLPGEYDLTVYFYPKPTLPSAPTGRPVAMARTQFIVPPIPGGRSNQPLDLGAVNAKKIN